MPADRASEYQVRPAMPADLQDVERVARATWFTTYGDAINRADIERFLHSNYSQEALERRQAGLERGFVVAVEGERVIGFASCGPNREAEMELFAIYVLPTRQGHGVGSALWTEVEKFVRDAGAPTFHLWVLATNDAAIRFYESNGGSRTDARSYPVGEAEIEEVRYDFAISG